MSRRRLLATAGIVAGTAAVTTVFGDTLRSVAYADTPSASNNVLVVVSLRGAVDGMGIVVPHGDAAYYDRAHRPTIAVPQDKLLCADSMFGLHPALAPLQKYWTSGELAAVTATGLVRPNRSHFSAMEEIEDADSTSAVRQGWVNRLIQLGSDAFDPLAATFLGSSTGPTLTVGPTETLAASQLSDLSLTGAEPTDSATDQAQRRASLRRVWNDIPGSVPSDVASLLQDGVTGALSVTSRLNGTASATYTPANGATYPTSYPANDLASALKDTAHLIKAGVGVEAVAVDFGSWDFHTGYGAFSSGKSGGMWRNLDALASSLDAFLTDLGPAGRSRVTVITISEFGRRFTENSAHGLDHGWGNTMLLMGAGVKGKQYYGTWPGLVSPTGASAGLVDDDLEVTTDYRDVLADVIASRFPSRSISSLFGSSYTRTPLGIMA